MQPQGVIQELTKFFGLTWFSIKTKGRNRKETRTKEIDFKANFFLSNSTPKLQTQPNFSWSE